MALESADTLNTFEGFDGSVADVEADHHAVCARRFGRRRFAFLDDLGRFDRRGRARIA